MSERDLQLQAEDPTLTAAQRLSQRVEDLEDAIRSKRIDLKQIPIASLQRKLHSEWQPDGDTLLLPESVGTTSLEDESVTEAKLADEAVTAAKIDDSAVTDPKRRIGNFYTGYLNTSVPSGAGATDHVGPTATVEQQGITFGVPAAGYWTVNESGLYYMRVCVWAAAGQFTNGYIYPYWEINGSPLNTTDGGGIGHYKGEWRSVEAATVRTISAGGYMRTLFANSTGGGITYEARTHWNIVYLGKTS